MFEFTIFDNKIIIEDKYYTKFRTIRIKSHNKSDNPFFPY
jgi:hypothetical protein